MEDRSALLRELHRKVLELVMPTDQISSIQFQPNESVEYFRRKLPKVARKEDLLSYLDRVGDANLLQQKGRTDFEVASASFADVRKWAGQLMDEGLVESVWTPQGIHWALKDHVPTYVAVYAQRSRIKRPEEKVLGLIKEKPRAHKDLARLAKMDKDDLNEALRKLERAYLVGRRGVEETIYFAREPQRAKFEEALDKVLTKRLEVDGPHSAQEVAVALGLEPELVEEVLRDLESEGIVSSGHFLVDKEFQYMLTRDLQRLQREGEAREVCDENQVQAPPPDKQFTSLGALDEYFDRFLEAGMVLDVYNHATRFDYAEWLRRREAGDILEGRFLNGRVRYVRSKDVPLFLAAFPRSALTECEAKVWDVIRAGDGVDLWAITAKLHEERERVKEALEKLDYDVYVIRRFQGDGWAARNLYVAFDPPQAKIPDAFETIVRRFLAAYGPVPFSGIREWARFEWDELERLMDRLEEEGVVTRILVTGKAESEMYVLKDDLPALRKAAGRSATDPLRVLSLLDPWTQPLWAEVASRYGEGWFFPLVKDGDLVGMAEIWEMSGAIEVREMDLASPDLLDEAIAALIRMMEFYTMRGVDVLGVTRFEGKAVPEAEDLSHWTRAGFLRFSDFLAHGPIVSQDFDPQDLVAFALTKQGVALESRFADPVAAAKALGGLRSDFAARLRAKEFRPLERLHRGGLLAKGLAIPEYWTYCTEEDLGLYKAAKASRLTKDMKAVLRVIQDDAPISRQRLLALSDLSRPTTAAALRKLYEGLHVTRDWDNRYRPVADIKISRDDARREVLRRIIRSLGVTSAEALAAYTRFEYNMGETRLRLREFEAEGGLAKGFLARGERAVVWAGANVTRPRANSLRGLGFPPDSNDDPRHRHDCSRRLRSREGHRVVPRRARSGHRVHRPEPTGSGPQRPGHPRRSRPLDRDWSGPPEDPHPPVPHGRDDGTGSGGHHVHHGRHPARPRATPPRRRPVPDAARENGVGRVALPVRRSRRERVRPEATDFRTRVGGPRIAAETTRAVAGQTGSARPGEAPARARAPHAAAAAEGPAVAREEALCTHGPR